MLKHSLGPGSINNPYLNPAAVRATPFFSQASRGSLLQVSHDLHPEHYSHLHFLKLPRFCDDKIEDSLIANFYGPAFFAQPDANRPPALACLFPVYGSPTPKRFSQTQCFTFPGKLSFPPLSLRRFPFSWFHLSELLFFPRPPHIAFNWCVILPGLPLPCRPPPGTWSDTSMALLRLPSVLLPLRSLIATFFLWRIVDICFHV